jgi:hypothetical protein
MPNSLYKQPLWKVLFLLVFLCTACNQKGTETTGKTGGDDHDKIEGKAPFIVTILKDKPTPAIVSGMGATYIKAVKEADPHLNVWHFTSSLSGEYQPNSFHKFIDANDGVKFTEEPESNQYGLYFGDYLTKTKVSVCGTTECKSQMMNLEMLLIQSNPEQFKKLLTNSSPLKVENPTSEWNLYFLDSSLHEFQNEGSVKLSIDPANKDTAFNVDWNGFLNNNEATTTKNVNEGPMILKWTQLKNREILAGTYTLDGTNYFIIGTKLFQLQMN